MNTKNEAKIKLSESLHNGLIVSCQVQKDDPIYTDDMAVKMAEAAKWGGAAGIRANSPEQISAIRSRVDLPINDRVERFGGLGRQRAIRPAVPRIGD